MGRKGKKVNPFAQKKRDRKEVSFIRFVVYFQCNFLTTLQAQSNGKPDRRSEPYKEIVRENESFVKYYKVNLYKFKF